MILEEPSFLAHTHSLRTEKLKVRTISKVYIVHIHIVHLPIYIYSNNNRRYLMIYIYTNSFPSGDVSVVVVNAEGTDPPRPPETASTEEKAWQQ